MGAAVSLLSYTIPAIKYTIISLILLNIHSFPLTWHIRHWWRLIPLYTHSLLTSPHNHLVTRAKSARLAGGASLRVTQKRRALPDDCDFNYHLSNSCYAKNSDISRSQWIFDALTPLLMSGTQVALGASHYVFVREIPMWRGYEMETRLVGWGDKWIYLVTEFLIQPKAKSKSKLKTNSATTPPVTSGSTTPASIALPSTTLHSALAGATVSLSSSDTTPSVLSIVDSLRTRPPRADGRIVAAYGVVEMCFKAGRITVPPRIGLHLAGLSPSLAEQARADDLTRQPRVAKAWLAGGWREAVDADDIGRDIDPSSPILTSEKNKSGQINTQVAEAMERVNAGLASAVHN